MGRNRANTPKLITPAHQKNLEVAKSAAEQRMLRMPVTYEHLPRAVSAAVLPLVAHVSDALRETDLSLLALVRLLQAKGVLTTDELSAEEQAIADELNAPAPSPEDEAAVRTGFSQVVETEVVERTVHEG